MYDDRMVDAARRLPPKLAADGPTPAQVETAAAANTASAAVAVGSATSPGYYSFACGERFNIVFDGDSTITDPSSGVYPFPAGVYEFWCGKDVTHFKFRPENAATMKHWKSGRATR